MACKRWRIITKQTIKTVYEVSASSTGLAMDKAIAERAPKSEQDTGEDLLHIEEIPLDAGAGK